MAKKTDCVRCGKSKGECTSAVDHDFLSIERQLEYFMSKSETLAKQSQEYLGKAQALALKIED